MENKFDYTETIENYIRGEMSGDQKIQFESQLTQDPLLKEELQLQEDLIHSIQDVRKTELKNRLDGVQIGIFDGITSTVGFKVLSTTLITAAIGMASYYAFFNKGEQSLEQVNGEQIAENTNPQAGQIIENEPEGEPATQTDDTEQKENLTPADKDEKPLDQVLQEEATAQTAKPTERTSSQETKPQETKPVEEEKPVDFNPVIPDLDDNFAEEDSTPANDIEVPDNELGPNVVEARATFEIENKSDTKNHFHYRFKSGKLILFGDFSNSTYEIIELNSTLGKSYYLYYDSNFYPLSVENTKITELRVLTDKTLIDELKKIKGDN